MKLSTQRDLVPRFRTNGAMPSLPLYAVTVPILLHRFDFFRFNRLRLGGLNGRRQQTTPFGGCLSFNDSSARPQLVSLTTNRGPKNFHSTSLQNTQSSLSDFLILDN